MIVFSFVREEIVHISLDKKFFLNNNECSSYVQEFSELKPIIKCPRDLFRKAQLQNCNSYCKESCTAICVRILAVALYAKCFVSLYAEFSIISVSPVERAT